MSVALCPDLQSPDIEVSCLDLIDPVARYNDIGEALTLPYTGLEGWLIILALTLIFAGLFSLAYTRFTKEN